MPVSLPTLPGAPMKPPAPPASLSSPERAVHAPSWLPTLFAVACGLIVANLARQVVPSHRHTVLVPAAALAGVLCCVVGQLLVTHLFDLRTTLSVVVNLVGGAYFLLLLMRTSRL